MSYHATAARASGVQGFTLIELMIVLGIVGILAALAVGGLMRARMSGNEASAIGSIRAVNSAQASYAAGCAGGGYAQSLDDLAKEPPSGVAFIAQGLTEDGTGKSGYRFSIDDGTDTTLVLAADATCNGSAEDALTTFYVHGEPIYIAVTGQRSFGSDQRGGIFQQLDGEEVTNSFGSATPLR